MQSKDLLKANLEVTMMVTLQLIEDMKDSLLVFPTPKGGNHPLWVLGHLAYSDCALLDGIMLGKDNPCESWKGLFDAGTEPVGDAGVYPSYDEILAKAQSNRQRHVQLLEAMSEEDLDLASKNAPEGFEPFFGTRRKCFLMVSNHWMMHRGQVADSRRSVGRGVLMA